ncbi:DoxX family protein [Marixanthomonas spongiae]|uniref:Methylamine utilisation protein MauE domain-containing protein n=1 Tax=Marixanthomonas spongiae TaxID=2174845 RepID=A0A2U0I5Q6_9FLAO|nr:MauE/DoxX family redox-associated membrane protein [Marixanthomonas spongiae]PVW16350.1 hypothetical protein DDV96_03570 [Marixanthomonas spongiae]
MTNLPWHQYLMGVLYILAGVNHFRKPKLYERIMPPYIPAHSTMVLLSGVAEMVFGLMLLNKDTQSIAAWGIIGMLIVFFTVHIYMLQDERAAMKLPKWALILRIPLQFALIYWAYLYT